MTSDLTFLTNEPGKSLLDRFQALLGGNTRLFDCLVGYFLISGFHKLYPALEETESIRILIGIKTDATVFQSIERAKEQQSLLLQSHAQAKEQLPADVLEELEHAEDTVEVERGIGKFIHWVASGKLQVRVYPSERIHAKVYILTFPEGHYDVGRVITGSSNFSQSGLVDNLEFNVELKNRSDYEFALTKFNELWERSVEVSKTYVDTIQKKSPYAQFTPYELYLKFLYEYFKGQLSLAEQIEDIYLPPGFKKLRYQEEAVLSAKNTLEAYGGVFLSDVVGLGKTYMSALLARELEGRSLVIAPPSLLDDKNPGSWPNVFHDFGVRGSYCASVGKLDDLLKRDISKYKNVFVDESHRFRTESTQSFEKLAQICRGKRVILVSATPLNNTPRDILSQIKLFQNSKKSTIPNQANLEAFFANLERKLRGLDRKRDRDEYFKVVQANAKDTREKILKYLMVRRTRTEIKNYYEGDLKTQGLKFPEVSDPEPLFYKFSKSESEKFFETLRLVTVPFKYARYQPLEYYTGPRDEGDIQSQKNVAKFMMILLVKRLESSFFAFGNTLSRFIDSYERVIREYRNGYVYVSKKYIHKIFQFLDQNDPEGIERLIDEEKAERLDAKKFLPNFIDDLRNDLKILKKIQEMWSGMKRDPKWNAFREVFQKVSRFRKGKLIIFTESKETAEYLAGRIANEIDDKVILFTGSSHKGERETVLANFDPRAFQPKDDYRILVTTEVLAEGVSLHAANIVINYDIPWNPTRMMQRVGRVNRVDTAFDRIYTYNFFPTDESEDVIKLKASAEAKIEAFIEMLGSDARLLTEGEEIKSHDLFMRLNSRKTITGEDEDEESELKYLTEIRAVRDTDGELFERIKRLPKKARSTRQVPSDSESIRNRPALLTYFRRGALDKFFLAQSDGPNVEVDFFSTARLLKPEHIKEKRQSISHKFYHLLERNKQAFVDVTVAEGSDGIPHRNTANDAYILKRLKAKDISRFQSFTDEDEQYIRQVVGLIDDGALPRPTTKKVATALQKESAPFKVLGILKREIPKEFFQATVADSARDAHSPREVILSSFIPASPDKT
ncbi:MAG: helicase-related protein [Acidobacteriota bacterium]